MFYTGFTDKGSGARRKADAMEENITSDNNECTEVKLTRAQDREVGYPERGTSAMTGEGIMDEIQALLWKLDDRKLRIVYQFIKKLIG